ncbi:MAG: hypothetical protein U0350_04905 [Caldilineaceae bacterium]
MSAKAQIVSDTGPLISLEKLSNDYSFIRQLYDVILVPSAVLLEVAQGQFSNPHDYLQHYGIADLIEVRNVPISHPLLQTNLLHPGEREAIQLALQLGLPLLIEETAGRTLAQNLGIHISGIAGQIIKAYRLGLIVRNDALTMLAELLHAGRINRKIYTALVAAV